MMTQEFKEGDKVYCLNNGNGMVIYVDDDDTYPINVSFSNGDEDCFTLDGYLFSDSKHPNLYHGHDLIITVSERLAEPVKQENEPVGYWVKQANRLIEKLCNNKPCIKDSINAADLLSYAITMLSDSAQVILALEADKAELLEALREANQELNKANWRGDLQENINALIAKMEGK